jgi:hypothetical protein
MSMDRAYKTKMYDALDQALVVASLDPETLVATVKTAEAAVALLELLAFLAAMSPATASPVKTEAFCGAVARELAAMIAEARRTIARGLPDLPDLEVICIDDEPDEPTTLH